MNDSKQASEQARVSIKEPLESMTRTRGNAKEEICGYQHQKSQAGVAKIRGTNTAKKKLLRLTFYDDDEKQWNGMEWHGSVDCPSRIQGGWRMEEWDSDFLRLGVNGG